MTLAFTSAPLRSVLKLLEKNKEKPPFSAGVCNCYVGRTRQTTDTARANGNEAMGLVTSRCFLSRLWEKVPRIGLSQEVATNRVA